MAFSVFYFFFGNRVWLNLYERALSGNESSIITGSCENLFNKEPSSFIPSARSTFSTGVRILYPVRNALMVRVLIPESVFYAQSVVRSP